jgi:hypothetical protein
MVFMNISPQTRPARVARLGLKRDHTPSYEEIVWDHLRLRKHVSKAAERSDFLTGPVLSAEEVTRRAVIQQRRHQYARQARLDRPWRVRAAKIRSEPARIEQIDQNALLFQAIRRVLNELVDGRLGNGVGDQFRLIRDAQQDGALVDENPLQVACFLMASVGLPRIIAAAWQGPPLFGKTLSATLGRIARDPDRVLQRLDWAIQGLTPRGR